MVCPITTIWWTIRWSIEIKKNVVSQILLVRGIAASVMEIWDTVCNMGSVGSPPPPLWTIPPPRSFPCRQPHPHHPSTIVVVIVIIIFILAQSYRGPPPPQCAKPTAATAPGTTMTMVPSSPPPTTPPLQGFCVSIWDTMTIQTYVPYPPAPGG